VCVGTAMLLLYGCSGSRTGDPGQLSPEAEQAYKRGSSALESGRYSDAIPELYAVLDEQPTHTLARYNLGVALLRVRQYKESVDVLAASHDPEVRRKKLSSGVRVPVGVDADYLHALGTVYQELREFDKALACFEGAIQDDPTHLKSRYALALTLEAQGELEAARLAWIDYIERDSDSAWTEGARKHLAAVKKRIAEKEAETKTP
jgi:tetratricopeptide (TPR) repeat protein